MDWSDGTFQLSEIAERSPIDHFDRFRNSNHAKDLYYICCVAAGLAAIFAVTAFCQATSLEIWAALITALLGVISWAYQAANTRFGAADLFAGEIAALCRIALVAEVMSNLAKQYRLELPLPAPAHETSEYFTAYNSNSKDMEVLDGDVVEAVAQFYANIKVFRDVVRSQSNGSDFTPKQLNAIYYGFLAFESARVALAVLIDDRERSREAILVAMLNELPAYILLYTELYKLEDRQKDVLWNLIHRRYARYCTLIGEIRKNLPEKGRGSHLAQQVLAFWDSCTSAGVVSPPADWQSPDDANRTLHLSAAAAED